MKKSKDLSLVDLNIIAKNEGELHSIVTQLEKIKQFKLDDILIAFRVSHHTGEKHLMKNSYDTPNKYKVVYIDKCNIPYVKEIGSKGELRGVIKPLMGIREETEWGSYGFQDLEFQHDPHFVESIILEAVYDPIETQRKKKETRDAITQHNLKAKINSFDIASLITAFSNMLPGQTYWFSVKNGMTIKSIAVVHPPKNHLYKRNITAIPEITVILSNGNETVYKPHDFYHRNLYSVMPRTYKELSDTI